MPVLSITKKSVDALPFEKSGRKRYRDSRLSGFFLRVSSTKKVYFVEKKIHGKPVKSTIGSHGQITAEQARKKAQKYSNKFSHPYKFLSSGFLFLIGETLRETL